MQQRLHAVLAARKAEMVRLKDATVQDLDILRDALLDFSREGSWLNPATVTGAIDAAHHLIDGLDPDRPETWTQLPLLLTAMERLRAAVDTMRRTV